MCRGQKAGKEKLVLRMGLQRHSWDTDPQGLSTELVILKVLLKTPKVQGKKTHFHVFQLSWASWRKTFKISLGSPLTTVPQQGRLSSSPVSTILGHRACDPPCTTVEATCVRPPANKGRVSHIRSPTWPQRHCTAESTDLTLRGAEASLRLFVKCEDCRAFLQSLMGRSGVKTLVNLLHGVFRAH